MCFKQLMEEELKNIKSGTILFPNSKLTIIIRDASPIYCEGGNPAFRTVSIDLTDEQREQLALKKSYFVEDVDKVILEPGLFIKEK